MKIVVRPSGEFSLVDPQSGANMKKGRISVIPQTNFASQRVFIGQLEMLGQLPDDAVEADFLETLKEMDGDVGAAIEIYAAELGKGADPEGAVKVSTPKKGAKSKADES